MRKIKEQPIMVRNKYSWSLLVLPLTFAIAWGRATYSYISYDLIYAFPSLAVFIFIGYVLLWSVRLRSLILKCESGDVYLKYFIFYKIKVSILTLLIFISLAELHSPIYYPIHSIFGMLVSILVFIKCKGRDAGAIKHLLLKSKCSEKDKICYQLLSGEFIKKCIFNYSIIVGEDESCKIHSVNFPSIKSTYRSDCDENTAKSGSAFDAMGSDKITDDSVYSLTEVNPATGLYMTGGGLDSGGNQFGNPEIMG